MALFLPISSDVGAQPFVLQPGPSSGKDIWTTSVFSYAPGGGAPGGGLNDEHLRIGGWGDEYYSLIEFDLIGFPQEAESATLRLFAAPISSNPTGFYLDRITEFWDWRTMGTGSDNERLWWADRPAATQWFPSAFPAPVRDQWYEIDITSLYNAWKSGAEPNYGLQLRPTATSNNNFEYFYSSDYTADLSLRPQLVVTPIAGQPSPELVLIPAGNFEMGNALSVSGDGNGHELPVHTVSVSTFYIQNVEVTKAQWNEVRTWGATQGYADLPVGEGKGSDHPVHSINWYAAVKWCNARSEMEGLTPVYYVDDTHMTIYRTGSVDVSITQMKWSANGFRLPTEAEWEKAARGDVSGARFPWGNTISHGQANYNGSSAYFYDVSPTNGHHPDYDDAPSPYTSPVGSFATNGYRLFDMAGNVWEWCGDRYSIDYYESSPGSDPTGPVAGSRRVLRGGYWSSGADNCRVTDRQSDEPGNSGSPVGFRPVRRPSPEGSPVDQIDIDPAPPSTPQATNLVFITHGWNSSENAWPLDAKQKIEEHLTENGLSDDWDVWSFNWEENASVPLAEIDYARNDAYQLGEYAGALIHARGYQRIHFSGIP